MTDLDDPTRTSPPTPPEPPAEEKASRRFAVALEWGILIIAALVIAFLIKTFLFQAFYIPSESMMPTLEVGDRVLVNKLSYDLHDVHRGDIVVFKAPVAARSDNIDDLVKRVIGLPGDVVEARDDTGTVCETPDQSRMCRVYVNERRIEENYLPDGTTTVYLPRTKVPAGHLFMMGDNREQSRDSRYFGAIKESSVIGRVFVRIWPPRSIGLF